MSDNLLHVDPQRQRAFIAQLNTRTKNIQNVIEVLESQLRYLGRDWQDAEYAQFVAQTKKTVQVLKAFIQEGRRVSLEITRAAELAENYQSIRQ